MSSPVKPARVPVSRLFGGEPLEPGRRGFLKRAGGLVAMTIAAPAILGADQAWAVEAGTLEAEQMATLIQMARDIYPHDAFPDALYAKAVASHDEAAAKDADLKALLESGIAMLDSLAQTRHGRSYRALGWEEERVSILHAIEESPFFSKIRGSLVVGLYNQPEVWALLGYEGSSAEKGGYLRRGFDDVTWTDSV